MLKTKLIVKVLTFTLFLVLNYIFVATQPTNNINAATYWIIENGSCVAVQPGSEHIGIVLFPSQEQCEEDLSQGSDGSPGWSAEIPCNPTCIIGGVLEFDVGDSGGQTVTTVLTVSIAIAAVVAFILAGFGAFRIVTSAGNPSGINAGREMIISAISGLLFIVFAVTILEIIGANILNLPGIESTPDVYSP